MTLELDARQRAMLDEMGVKVWWPTSVAAAAVAESEAEASALAGKPAVWPTGPGAVAGRERTTPAPPLSPSVQPSTPLPLPPTATSMAPTKAAAATGVASPSSPQGNAVLIGAPERLYDDASAGADTAQGGWLVVADMAPEPDGRHGAPFAGDVGRLLDNMLRALQLHRGEQPVYLVRTYRGSTTEAASAAATSDVVAAGAPANITSTFAGHFAAQALFDSTEPLGKLRGRVATPLSLPDAALIATYPPAYLLRNPADKARAWADLCAAAKIMDERADSKG